MAKNPNPTLPNRNTLYISRTGGGKSQALKQNPEIPRDGVRCFLWDNAHDQWRGTHYFTDLSEFAKAAERAAKSGRGFRIGYSGDRTPAKYELFCKIIWYFLDGRYLTYVIVEELGRCCRTNARADSQHERLLSEGRKFGLRFHATNQRTEEIPKTVTGNCEVRYTGPQEGNDAANSAKIVGVQVDDLLSLHPLEFYVRDYSKRPTPWKIQLNYAI